MSREIANAGYGLSTNGVVAGDSGLNQIRVRADLDCRGQRREREDLKYVLIYDANGSSSSNDLPARSDDGLIATASMD